MNIIFLGRGSGRPRHINLAHPLIWGGLVLVVVAIGVGTFLIGRQLGLQAAANQPALQVAAWSRELADQRAQLDEARRMLKDNVDALAKRVGLMNAHVIRLDALGRRLTQMAKIDDREFDFGHAPAQGGPQEYEENGSQGQAPQVPDLTAMIDRLDTDLQKRDVQLGVIENFLMTRSLNEQIYPQGRPVLQGWISSFFGLRVDPFGGYSATHKGLDFAGKAGTSVSAVAAGVVTWAGDRSGYGQLVEINHGNGYSTRYGHNQRNLVRVGQTVQKGQAVALMGSTGRSTGPHVHFEVLKNGRQVNPLSFIGR